MSETTIEEAVQAFALWRTQRKGKSKTPDHLKAMAISLLARYPMSEVCKRLVINSSTLKVWGGLKKPSEGIVSSSDFVTLEPSERMDAPHGSEISLLLSTNSGIHCKLTGALEPNFIASLLKLIQGDHL